MRAVQALLLAGILVALTIIAIDLHRLSGNLSPSGQLMQALFGDNAPAGETRAQRNQRLAHESDEFFQDMDARTKGALPPTRAREHPAAKPQR